jgi:hypothetical protein
MVSCRFRIRAQTQDYLHLLFAASCYELRAKEKRPRYIMALEIQALVGAETKMCLYFCIWTKFMSDHLIGHFSAVSCREQFTFWCDDDNADSSSNPRLLHLLFAASCYELRAKEQEQKTGWLGIRQKYCWKWLSNIATSTETKMWFFERV